MRLLDSKAVVKAVPGADGTPDGTFTALVSVFGNADSYGDVVMPGAFTDTLARKSMDGQPLPVIWSHDWGDPFSVIGTVAPGSAVETSRGLQVTGTLDLANPKAAQVYALMKSGRISQFSFAYDVVDAEPGVVAGEPVNMLKTLDLFEVGPCLLGVNQETELLALKAQQLAVGVKSGRVLAQKHLDKLAGAHKALGEVLAAATDGGDEEKGTTAPSGTTTPTGTSTAEDPQRGKADRTGFSPSTVLLLADIHALED